MSDELTISAIRTMVRTYGQMPLNLFASPHLSHLRARKRSFPTSSSSGTLSSIAKSASNIISLESKLEKLNYVFYSVNGLKWGLYCGSPEIKGKYLKTPNFTFQVNRSERYLFLFIFCKK